MRTTIALALACWTVACASAPPAAPPSAAPLPSLDQKMEWILRLEDQRVLRDPEPPPRPQTPPPPGPRQRNERPVPAMTPPPVPDLIVLLSDAEARVRRRAALAVGRVGLHEAVEPLVRLLRDAEPEVAQMAAFALGLIGDRSAREALVSALDDESPLVQGSAAEALGLMADPGAADAVGRLASRIIESGSLNGPPEDEADARRDLPASAFRLAIYALVRLNAYNQLAAAVLDASGQPRVRWWPVAYALQRIEDRRASGALRALLNDAHPYTRAFAAKGLGALKDQGAVPALFQLLSTPDRGVLIETVRALGRIGDPAAASALIKLMQAKDTDPHVRLTAIAALGTLHAPGVLDLLLDLLTDPGPAIRAAALQSAAAFDPDGFVIVLSGLDADAAWDVRAALASVLGTLTRESGVPRLMTMLGDEDQRVVPAVLDALVRLRAPGVADLALARLEADDPGVRAAAARGIGELKPAGGDRALAEAYQFGQRDPLYTARAAALAALAAYGAEAAAPVLRTALADKDWAVRVRAAMLLKQLDPESAADVDRQMRPAPTKLPVEQYQAERLINPRVSTEVYVDTDRGTIQIELAVLDAPLTVENFVTLARQGYFNGLRVHRVVPDFVVQDGDPRGDGEGGPGHTIRDEINQRPYLRGTVGMALDPWPDTGGSQFFIAHSPQPHLDAKYTVFGRVVSGMDVVDRIQQGDMIRGVRVWDGDTMGRVGDVR